MRKDKLQRKLTAIFHCDVVGYSRHVSGDSSGTHQRLSASLGLISDRIEEHDGQVIHEAGDAILADFGSVVSAVEAAVSVQQELKRGDGNLEFRIGVNLGEVIIDRDDIYGEGVNVAARLEALADPGCICISRAVYDQVAGELDLDYEDIGPQELKNIPKPVGAFKIRVEKPSEIGVVSAKAQSSRRAIAVLPFENLSNDPEQEYFSDGVSEDIIAAISRYHWLSVSSRNSTFLYKEKTPDIAKIGEELGVSYVLSGSVRKAGNRIRITVELTSTGSENQLWTERYDRKLEDIFELQDEITETIAAAIEPQLARSERQRARGVVTENMDAWDLFQQGQWHMFQFSGEHVAKALDLFAKASRVDSEFAPAYAGLSVAFFVQVVAGYAEDAAEATEKAVAFGERAVALDDQDPFSYYALGRGAGISNDPDRAEWALRKAIEINRSYALAYHAIAQLFSTIPGKESAGLEFIDQAIKLSPNDPLISAFEGIKATCFFALEDYDDAFFWARKACLRPNVGAYPYCTLAACHHLRGEKEEAGLALKKAFVINPDMHLSRFEKLWPGAFPNFIAVLREMGFPE